MSAQALKIGDRLRIANPKAPGNEIYPPEIVFRVVGFHALNGRERVGACCGPFAGYPYGVERWDYVEGWTVLRPVEVGK